MTEAVPKIPLHITLQLDDYEITDGIPHITYQPIGRSISFVWDGQLGHPVLVCPNGYGEPATSCFNLHDPGDAYGHTPDSYEWFLEFQLQCDEWLA